MIVQCVTCKAHLRVADEQVPEDGIKLRCSKCKTVFRVRKPVVVAPTPRAEAPAATTPTTPSEHASVVASAPMPSAPLQEFASSDAPQERTALFGSVAAVQPAEPKPAQTKLFGDAPAPATPQEIMANVPSASDAASEMQMAESLKRVLAFESTGMDLPSDGAARTEVTTAVNEGTSMTALFGDPPTDVGPTIDAAQESPLPSNSTQLFGQQQSGSDAPSGEIPETASAGALLESSLFGGAPPVSDAPVTDGSAALEAQLFGSPSEATALPGTSTGEALAAVEASLFDLPIVPSAPTSTPVQPAPQGPPATAEASTPELLSAKTSGIDVLFEDFEPAPSSGKEAAPGSQALDEKPTADMTAPAPAQSPSAADSAATIQKDEEEDKSPPDEGAAPEPVQRRGSGIGAALFVLATLALLAAIALAAFHEPVRAKVHKFFDQSFGQLIGGVHARSSLVIEDSTFTLPETKTDKKLLVFTCRVRNRGTTAEESRRVSIDLIGESGTVARTTAILGASATREELYEIGDEGAFELLLQNQLKRGKAVEPGKSQRIVVIFRDYPAKLAGLRLSFHWDEGKAARERGQ